MAGIDINSRQIQCGVITIRLSSSPLHVSCCLLKWYSGCPIKCKCLYACLYWNQNQVDDSRSEAMCIYVSYA